MFLKALISMKWSQGAAQEGFSEQGKSLLCFDFSWTLLLKGNGLFFAISRYEPNLQMSAWEKRTLQPLISWFWRHFQTFHMTHGWQV